MALPHWDHTHCHICLEGNAIWYDWVQAIMVSLRTLMMLAVPLLLHNLWTALNLNPPIHAHEVNDQSKQTLILPHTLPTSKSAVQNISPSPTPNETATATVNFNISRNVETLNISEDQSYPRVCPEGALVFSRNDRHFKCADDVKSHHKDLQNFIQTESIRLLGQNVGHITQLCEGDINGWRSSDNDNTLLCRCLLPKKSGQRNVNTPSPIRLRSWMTKHPIFQGQSMVMYYSSHTEHSIGILVKHKFTQVW